MGLGSGLITSAFGGILQILLWAVTLVTVFAFVDAALRPAAAYEAAGKLTKVAWLLFLGIAAFYDAKWGSVTSMLTILGAVAMIVYLVDVRPALRQVAPRTRKGRQDGPYGPW